METDRASAVDVYCNGCGLRATEPMPPNGLPTPCPECQSPRRMLAPHDPKQGDLPEFDDSAFDAFIGRSAFGIRRVGDSDLSFGFELPWLQYENEEVRAALRETVPELAVDVPYRKEGETRGPAGDLLVIYLLASSLVSQIVLWAELGDYVDRALTVLRARAPSVLITDGTAMTIGARAHFDQLAIRDMEYAFTLPTRDAVVSASRSQNTRT